MYLSHVSKISKMYVNVESLECSVQAAQDMA